MGLDEAREQFRRIRHSKNMPELFEFSGMLTASHGEPWLEYHLSLLKETDVSPEMHQELCRKFARHGEAGERFLLRRIQEEGDARSRATMLQILGGMKYSGGKHPDETAAIARELLLSEGALLRSRATMVLGWLGGMEDVPAFRERLLEDKDAETRGMAASALMQLGFNSREAASRKGELLAILMEALPAEKEDSVLNCILVSIQELSGKKLGLSARSRDTPSNEKLERARARAMKRSASERTEGAHRH